MTQGRLEARWLDESDCVGAWQSDSLAAVVLPTADSLDALREIDADRGGRRLILVFNPQWQTDGQIVSDFGCVLFYRAPLSCVLSSVLLCWRRCWRVMRFHYRPLSVGDLTQAFQSNHAPPHLMLLLAERPYRHLQGFSLFDSKRQSET